MASRPDYLISYDAQSFPVQMDHNQPFVPPADYPMDDLMLRPKRPKSPPMDYQYKERYPFRTYGDGQSYRHSADVVRTTAEANRVYEHPVGPQPSYPAPRHDHTTTVQYAAAVGRQTLPPASSIVRRHTTLGSELPIRPRSSSAMNKAFLHHLKNFDKFATVKGRGACCTNCPICKAITAANVALSEDAPSPGNTPPLASTRATAESKPPRDSQDSDDDPEAYQKERRQNAFLSDLSKRGAKVARVVADRVSRHIRELTVTKGEYLEVLDDARRWCACSNVSGQLGYVPSEILVLVTI